MILWLWKRLTRKADERVVEALAHESWRAFLANNLRARKLGIGFQYLRGAHLTEAKKFIRRYYRKHGRYPVGWHRIFKDRLTLFTPTPASPLVPDADLEAHA